MSVIFYFSGMVAVSDCVECIMGEGNVMHTYHTYHKRSVDENGRIRTLDKRFGRHYRIRLKRKKKKS